MHVRAAVPGAASASSSPCSSSSSATVARVGAGALGGRPALDLVALWAGGASSAEGCAVAALLRVVLVTVSWPFAPAMCAVS